MTLIAMEQHLDITNVGVNSDVPPFLYPLKRRVPVFYGLGLVG
ncbi:hypothetical protein AtDm6_1616 [Acetobacter tropicalis]|uniref:Uncharacterized protein n=1 Tax=Acetobacter tropicalis TaxID=104102 RepID=A0A094YQI9_9PROT|nr:hypothetical protein AtDm6_1616 [Acetobacter tropicalis]